MDIDLENIKGFFTSKKVWMRIMLTITLLGVIAYLILTDNSLKCGPGKVLEWESKSNVRIKK